MTITFRSAALSAGLVAGMVLLTWAPASAAQLQFVRNTVDLSGAGSVQEVAVGDFDGDGNPDSLTVDTSGDNELLVLLGDGRARFGPPIRTPQPGYVIAAVPGDYNEDGDLDVLVANVTIGSSDRQLIFAPGDGTGRFGSGTAFSLKDVSEVESADMDGDGHLDLVTRLFSLSESGDKVRVLAGHGDGTFSKLSQATLPYDWPYGVAVADINGDDRPDVGVGSNQSIYSSQPGEVQVLLNNGSGGLVGSQLLLAGINPSSLPFGDLDGDGDPDLITAHDQAGKKPDPLKSSIAVFLNDGAGRFTEPSFYPAGARNTAVETADFNSDGQLDVVVGDRFRNHSVSVLLGDGTGSLAAPTRALIGGDYPDDIVPVAVADFNLDGRPDILTSGDYDFLTVGINRT